MKIAKIMTEVLIADRNNARRLQTASIHDIGNRFDSSLPFELGTFATKESALRTRKQIYTQWQIMQSDPQVGEALSLHVTAALGGHESNGDVIFITPHERVRGKGRRAKELHEKVEREAKLIAPLLNRVAFSLSRQAIGYGDSFARIYTQKDRGVIDIINDESTQPATIQAFEQGGKTIGFFALEQENWTDVVAKLTPLQMLRIKMPRIEHIPQTPLANWDVSRKLEYDVQADIPINPSPVGGSFLYQIEEPWKSVTISRLALNNQQIADSVKQAFLAINMQGMPPNQQKKYKSGLVNMLKNYNKKIEAALSGGKEIYGTHYHIVPTYGDKQTITPMGDISNRSSPLNENTLMINLRRLAGGLGIDLSLIGWADMLAGGLGDGASFHTSAQIMRRSTLIRQALIDGYNNLMSLHWGVKYGEYFEDGNYPWQFDFYSDQSAAATEALTNKQARLNTIMLKVQAYQGLRDLGLSKQSIQLILEDAGEDFETAKKIAEELAGAHEQSGDQDHGVQNNPFGSRSYQNNQGDQDTMGAMGDQDTMGDDEFDSDGGFDNEV